MLWEECEDMMALAVVADVVLREPNSTEAEVIVLEQWCYMLGSLSVDVGAHPE